MANATQIKKGINLMNSIMSFPNRGQWGDWQYRGNCSGHIIKKLIENYNPNFVLDPAEGSGTSRDVCQAMKITYQGFDLRTGFDILTNPLNEMLQEEPDLVFFHPPYHNIIKYSGGVWGEPHPNDMSRCDNYENYVKQLRRACLNIHSAIKQGCRIAILIGDIRKKGTYYSPQAEIQKFPIGNIESIIIKAQHNVKSNNKKYSGSFIPVMHEYLLIFKK